jgi:hypothetical protein
LIGNLPQRALILVVPIAQQMKFSRFNQGQASEVLGEAQRQLQSDDAPE